ncbi:MAG TPA: hypothetical protein VFM88_10245 [Vicinamibacteria bacterium]|nr:hypothetical protein [Vicinamibacteria bacterium]
MAKTIRVRIDDDKGPVVRPVVVTLLNGEPVSLINETRDEVRVILPGAGIDAVVPGDGRNNDKLDGQLAGLRSGRHRYAVYCNEVDDFAEGASSPEIIIKP